MARQLTDQERNEILTLYQIANEELRETKREGWTLTNYFIAAHVAAIYYVKELFDEKPPIWMLWTFSGFSVLLLGYVVWRIHCKSTGRNQHHRRVLRNVTDELGEPFLRCSEFGQDRDNYLSSAWDSPINIALIGICVLTTAMFLVYLVHIFPLPVFCLHSAN
jgi:hypothetical protein